MGWPATKFGAPWAASTMFDFTEATSVTTVDSGTLAMACSSNSAATRVGAATTTSPARLVAVDHLKFNGELQPLAAQVVANHVIGNPGFAHPPGQ